MDQEARIEALEAEVFRLRELVANYEIALGAEFEPHVALGLTELEARIVGLLVKKGSATREQIFHVLYGLRNEIDVPEMKIVDVFVCKGRQKLKRFGIEIKTVWGQGYAMDEDSRAKCRELCGGAA